jgi:hypothetical protein
VATQPKTAEPDLPTVEELSDRQLLEEVVRLGRRIAEVLEDLAPLLDHPLVRVYIKRRI